MNTVAGSAVEHRGTLQASAIRVLVLADADTPGTAALINALTAAGYAVTERPPPQYTWDGVTPSPNDFDCIIHLDGKGYSTALPTSTQQALESFVSGGGGFIGEQFDGYALVQKIQTAMPDLVLQTTGGRSGNNCGDCTMTWSVVAGQESHPVLAGISASFSFYAEGHDAGPQVAFYNGQASTVLMRAPSNGPAVLVRDYGQGHVVGFAAAPNYSNASPGATLQDPNILKLYVNAVAWAGQRPQGAVSANAGPNQTLEASGPMTSVVLDGSGSSPLDGSYLWREGPTALASAITADVQLGVGNHDIVLSVTNAAGASATGHTTVTILHSTPPALSLPSSLVVEATDANGAVVQFQATAKDMVDGAVAVTCQPAAGAVFPLGVTTVACAAANSQGSAAHGSFSVTVQDTTPPVFAKAPLDLTVEATGPAGATASWPTPTALDAVDGPVAVSCSPSSGSMFPMGATSATCSATDAHGNAAKTSFLVTVFYGWSGLLRPVHADGSSVFRRGQMVPVWFRLTGASAGIADLQAHLYLASLDYGALGTLHPAAGWQPEQRRRTAPTNVFGYAEEGEGYFLLVSTAGLSPGKWAFVVDLGDGVQHATAFSIRARNQSRDENEGGDDDE